MFGIFRIAKARNACARALQPFVVQPRIADPWPARFWRDPFVIGFFTKMIATVSILATSDKLTKEQQGQVFIDTLKDAGGYAPDLIDRILEWTKARDPAFVLGTSNADTVVTYMMNLHPMPGDTDVAAATKVAEAYQTAMGKTGNVGREEIGGALMHLLFSQVVQKRLAI